MKSLVQNEILGVIALQETLKNMPENEMELTNSLLILPLLFNKRSRTLLKDNRIKFLSAKDLIISYPEIFLGLRNIYLDMTLTSLNTLILATDISLIEISKTRFFLKRKSFPYVVESEHGKIAAEISKAANNAAKILQENPVDLHLNFRIAI